jgi:hypothetical protein
MKWTEESDVLVSLDSKSGSFSGQTHRENFILSSFTTVCWKTAAVKWEWEELLCQIKYWFYILIEIYLPLLLLLFTLWSSSCEWLCVVGFVAEIIQRDEQEQAQNECASKLNHIPFFIQACAWNYISMSTETNAITRLKI